jgi:membrane fusion protein (multidrug efflux system)
LTTISPLPAMTSTETSPLASPNGRSNLTAAIDNAPPAKAARSAPEAQLPPPAVSPPAANAWPRRILFAVILLVAGAAAGVYYVTAIAPYESTDDAFIDGHVMSIAPQVAGQVVSLSVKDNEAVKQGDVLFQIDPRDYQMKLDEARADLAATQSRLDQTKAEFAVDQAKDAQEQASVTAAEADASRAQTDLQRYLAVESRAVAQSQIDLAQDQASTTAAQVAVAKNRALAADAQVNLSQADIKTAEANVERAQAVVDQAELDLSYTKVTAPEDGFVTHRSVEIGNYVQPGQATLAIVPPQVWVIANFKETQLAYMHPGQPVEITLDAYPQHKFHGHVDSIQAGSGAHFSLLPSENATGNYVKVVQRVPVKIVFDDPMDPAHPLGPGMSVVPVVKVK